MQKTIFTLFTLLLVTVTPVLSFAGDLPDSIALRVVIIRHGEKPKDGSDNLSCKGLNRALRLPDVLDSLFDVPKHTYVPALKTGKSTTSARMFQTVTPYAVRHKLTINTKYSVPDTAKVAIDVKEKKHTVLLVWEHKHIPGIARNLGVKNVPGWDGDDFDSIWVIDFIKDKNKLRPELRIIKEGIEPVKDCSE
jgi:hypothetical protein